MPNSVIFTIGGDASDFDKKLAATQQKAAAASKDAGKGDDLRVASVGRVKRQVAELAQTILSGADAADVLTQSAIALGNSFKFGLGIAAAVSVGGLLFHDIHRAVSEAEALKKAIKDATSPTGPADYSTLAELQTRLEATAAAAKSLHERSVDSFTNRKNDVEEGIADHPGRFAAAAAVSGIPILGTLAVGAFTGAAAISGKENRDAEQAALNSAGQSQTDLQAEKQHKLNDLEQHSLEIGAQAVALAKLELEYKERLGDIARQTTRMAADGLYVNPTALVDAAKAEHNIKQDALQTEANEEAKQIEKRSDIMRKERDHEDAIAASMAVELDYQQKIELARRAGHTQTAHDLDEQRSIALEILDSKRQEGVRNGYRPSIGEIAAHGGGHARAEAQRSEREAQLARDAYGRGDKAHGDIHANRSEDAKSMLGEIGAGPLHDATPIGTSNAKVAADAAAQALIHPHRDRVNGDDLAREAYFTQSFHSGTNRADEIRKSMNKPSGGNGGFTDALAGFKRAIDESKQAQNIQKIADKKTVNL